MATGVSIPTYAVDRPTLRRRVDEALGRPLTLLVAPAGAGKSVLLAQWAAGHPELPMVWMPLTSADDDPVRFSQRLLSGLSELDPDAAELGPLVSMHGGGLGTPLLEALGTELADLPEMVIVLDDLHQLSNATLIADLGHLAEQLPSNVAPGPGHPGGPSHCVEPPPGASRPDRDPPGRPGLRQWPTPPDCSSGSPGGRWGPTRSTALVQRTEGWAAGLHLAGHDPPGPRRLGRVHQPSSAGTTGSSPTTSARRSSRPSRRSTRTSCSGCRCWTRCAPIWPPG